MDAPTAASPRAMLRTLDALLPDLELVYKDVHAHPELSMEEGRTSALAAERLRAAGYEVTTGVGKTGVVGLLRNGDGPTVMLRADMDALPVEEGTGLPYASKVTAPDQEGKMVSVSHMCGHDMHVTWLVGATKLLAEARRTWRGTLIAVFQPGEETAEGAQAMIDDGLFKRFPKPDVVLDQHVMVGPAGTVAGRAGAITSAADSLQIRLFGRGAHGSMPQASIDPVVMAAATVLRLQTIVSREIAASDAAVVTVGALQAGTKENVIPDEAIIKLNVRTFDAGVREHVLAAIARIVKAEAAASGALREGRFPSLRPPPRPNSASGDAHHSTLPKLGDVAFDLAPEAGGLRSGCDRRKHRQRLLLRLHGLVGRSGLEVRQGQGVEVHGVRLRIHRTPGESQCLGGTTLGLGDTGQEPEGILVQIGRTGGGSLGLCLEQGETSAGGGRRFLPPLRREEEWRNGEAAGS